MTFAMGEWVLAGGLPAVVETSYQSADEWVYVTITETGRRGVHTGDDVRAIPPPVDPVRRKAVDLILDFKGVSRGDLFEYPYNEHESRTRIRDAEALLDKLLKVLEK